MPRTTAYMPVTKKQLQAKIRKYNKTHCLKVTGTKTALRRQIEGRKGLSMPKVKKKRAAKLKTGGKKRLAAAAKKSVGSYFNYTHSASKRNSAPVASAKKISKKQARVNAKTAARNKALNIEVL